MPHRPDEFPKPIASTTLARLDDQTYEALGFIDPMTTFVEALIYATQHWYPNTWDWLMNLCLQLRKAPVITIRWRQDTDSLALEVG